MTVRRTVTGFAILLMFLVGASPPFVHSSRPCKSFQHSQAVAEEEMVAADNMESQLQEGNRKEGGLVDESAREVPTGPDPLHHNNKPSRP
ncbi:PREDICTED: uncharacterized protein LOC109148731 isoform X2 [Ipomoea nil]|uniref:uncharacterized protein LOC109148731 isoform X2 n=1 Tax=Ipomoea nil TaxID=35883 RepID=UPI000901D006|nr:PREDICTED: uncharacterized protein LOC109148731 isoform X2 [Ipomoea nil]